MAAKNKIEPRLDIDGLSDYFSYRTCDWSYDTLTDCESAGCESDGICRCGIISNGRVNSVDPHDMAKVITSKSCEPILFYCVERILTHTVTDANLWDLNVVGGYYGEEVEGASLNHKTAGEVKEMLNTLLSKKNNREKIIFALETEYGYVLDALKAVKKFEVKCFTFNDASLMFKSEEHYKRLDRKTVDRYKMSFENNDYKNIPVAICLERENGIRLIDGYHRLRGAEEANKKKVDIIYGS